MNSVLRFSIKLLIITYFFLSSNFKIANASEPLDVHRLSQLVGIQYNGQPSKTLIVYDFVVIDARDDKRLQAAIEWHKKQSDPNATSLKYDLRQGSLASSSYLTNSFNSWASGFQAVPLNKQIALSVLSEVDPQLANNLAQQASEENHTNSSLIQNLSGRTYFEYTLFNQKRKLTAFDLVLGTARFIAVSGSVMISFLSDNNIDPYSAAIVSAIMGSTSAFIMTFSNSFGDWFEREGYAYKLASHTLGPIIKKTLININSRYSKGWSTDQLNQKTNAVLKKVSFFTKWGALEVLIFSAMYALLHYQGHGPTETLEFTNATLSFINAEVNQFVNTFYVWKVLSGSALVMASQGLIESIFLEWREKATKNNPQSEKPRIIYSTQLLALAAASNGAVALSATESFSNLGTYSLLSMMGVGLTYYLAKERILQAYDATKSHFEEIKTKIGKSKVVRASLGVTVATCLNLLEPQDKYFEF